MPSFNPDGFYDMVEEHRISVMLVPVYYMPCSTPSALTLLICQA